MFLSGAIAHAFEASGTIRAVEADQGLVRMFANGRERTVAVATNAVFLGADGKPLAAGLKSPELKAGAEVTVSVDRSDLGPVLRELRLGERPEGARAAPAGNPSVGLKPLTEMTADDRYQGEDGGLYGGGRNEPPPAHLAAARKQSARIAPLDAEGQPSDEGKIGMVSISMSNATQEYSLFKELADRDPRKSPRVAVVDCAQGGQAMAEWVDPAAPAWREADRRLAAAKVSPRQVQVVWVKLANKMPRGSLAEHGAKLRADTLAVLRNAKARFPNLRVAYLGSRIYGGYAATPLNPEPYAYESAFVARRLILDQIAGDAALRFDDAKEPAPAPLLLWGPYFWADGTTPRKADGLAWIRDDFVGDGTHPSTTGRRKVADMLLKFFAEDPLARAWFARAAAGGH